MDEYGLPLVGTGIDYTKVAPIDKKRLLAFVNHYVMHTARFLNHFACVCEDKMSTIEGRLQHLEVTMNILEAKLSSIPGLESVTIASSTTSNSANTSSTPTTAPAASTSQAPATTPLAATPATEQTPEPPPEPEQNVPKVSQDPRYQKYFKMVNMGVPPTAVKMKMKSEGVDPDLLDNPDAPAPPGGTDDNSGSESGEDDDNDTDFSD